MRALASLLLAILPAPGCLRHEVLLLVDQNAGPEHHGALFAIDPATGEARLFATSALLRQPQDVMQEADGSLLVLDYYDEGGTGKVFRFAADGRRCHEVTLPPGLVDPFQFERAPDGSIWIVDKNADPLDLGKRAGQRTGTLWRLSADMRSLDVVATGPPLQAPAGIVFAGRDAFLMDADAFQQRPFRLANDEGAIFRVRWHPEPLETLVRFRRLVSPLGMHRESTGTFLVVDVNADPEQRERIRGAVYRVDPVAGTTVLFARHEEFRDPVTCLAWQGRLLVVDANADPLQLGDDGVPPHPFAGSGRGGVYAVDLQSRTVTRFAASREFVNPVRLRTARL